MQNSDTCYLYAPVRISSWVFTITLLLLSPVLMQGQAPGAATLPVIDMHFHTMREGPNTAKPSTSFAPVATPEEMRRRNIAALDRNHVVKAVASGDQLDTYVGELGRRLLPGILFPDPTFKFSPEALRQFHNQVACSSMRPTTRSFVRIVLQYEARDPRMGRGRDATARKSQWFDSRDRPRCREFTHLSINAC